MVVMVVEVMVVEVNIMMVVSGDGSCNNDFKFLKHYHQRIYVI